MRPEAMEAVSYTHLDVYKRQTAKRATTGIGYEPWHYRYVGKEAASDIAESGLCLEEWLVETYHVQA